MSDSNLESKFPDLRPVRYPPPLFHFWGCGCGLYGSRDFDAETFSYVTTYCLSLLGIPVLALRAYRVAELQGGYGVIGRVPLSRCARAWNVLLLVAVAGVVAGLYWHRYTSSADYQAGRQLAQAERLAAEGQVAQAARLCQDVALGGTSQAGPAMERLKDLLDGPVTEAPPQEAAAALAVAVELRDRPGAVTDLFDRGVKLADRHEAADPLGALLVIDAVAPAAPEPAAALPRRRRLLERLVKADPADVEHAARLAVVYEAQGERDRCEALLSPHRDRLGLTEGARILGQLYAHQGKFDQAHALLLPYTDGRLQKLHAAEKSLAEAVKRVQDRAIKQIRNGTAPGFDFRAFQQAGKDRQQEIGWDYVDGVVGKDPEVKRAQQAVMRGADVVPVALDLGLVLLRRGQAQADPDARRAELERAEKTFLAVRGVADKTDQYRLFLGQVYYWLGRHAEGRKLFDELLASRGRDFATLVGVSELLREVGAVGDARTLIEEAYAGTQDAAKKSAAAMNRSAMFLDRDDEITWLERASPGEPGVKAALAMARGNKALDEGRWEEAATHLRAAIAAYAAQPESAATLNDASLAYFSLYHATGEHEALDKGLALQEKAVALSPSNSLLLGNLAQSAMQAALRDVIGNAIDLRVLKESAEPGLLQYLYADKAGRDRLADRLRKHAGVARALAYLERAQTLEPKSERGYRTLTAVYAVSRDLEALKLLWGRLEKVELDLTDYTRETRAFYLGANDARILQVLKTNDERLAAVLPAARRKGGATLALALGKLAGNRMGLEVLGQPGKGEEPVALAEQADAAAPSAATRALLISTLLARADRELAKTEPTYAALAARGRRGVGASHLIGVGLGRSPECRKALLAHADVRRAVDLVKETAATFDDDSSPWGWAMLAGAYPEEAAKVAAALRRDEADQLLRRIRLKLSPLSGEAGLEAFWSCQAAGNEAEGTAILRRLLAQQVPLPLEPK
jgi:hypothetical protein